MSKTSKVIKVRMNPWRIILIFSLVYIGTVLLFYSILQPWYLGDFNPFSKFYTYIYMAALLVAAIIFCVLSITKTYYELDDKKISHHKMGTEDIYYYSDIVYIDEKWSKKHKMLNFYLRSGKSRTLAFDKEGLIFKYAMEHSRLMSEEEFRAKYHNAK